MIVVEVGEAAAFSGRTLRLHAGREETPCSIWLFVLSRCPTAGRSALIPKLTRWCGRGFPLLSIILIYTHWKRP
ncbi:protein of unknown function [Kyrpidia spormannii]|uniref:Uncharacterized protein n=1 Tax=Kyrpidia spormannii TaxID=2055160 RepID=A0A6F9EAS9_9BACL|nr:protein of unknown function [Kyrpidia spormannii]